MYYYWVSQNAIIKLKLLVIIEEAPRNDAYCVDIFKTVNK